MRNRSIKTTGSLKNPFFGSAPGVLRFTSLILIVVLLNFMHTYSQEPSERILTGKVTFAEDNQPVP